MAIVRPERFQTFLRVPEFLGLISTGKSAVVGDGGHTCRTSRHQQRPTLSKNMLQPCACHLRSENRGHDERRVERCTNDPGIEGYAGEYDTGSAACIRCDRKIDQV